MQICKLTSATPVLWSDGSNFNGYLIAALSPPTSGGINWPGDGIMSFTSPESWQQSGQLRLPDFYVIPIYGGTINQNVGVFANADINPPGSKYYLFFYDIARKKIADPVGNYTFANSQETITVPTLTVPTPAAAAQTPDS